MATVSFSLDKFKRVWHSEVHNPEKWAANMKLLRAAGIFVGSIIVIRNFGDLLAGETA